MERNGMHICLNNNHLPDFSFISLTSESETYVELYPKLKLTNINLSKIFFKFHSRKCYCIYLFVYLFRKLPVS